jgi:hypothetical protein
MSSFMLSCWEAGTVTDVRPLFMARPITAITCWSSSCSVLRWSRAFRKSLGEGMNDIAILFCFFSAPIDLILITYILLWWPAWTKAVSGASKEGKKKSRRCTAQSDAAVILPFYQPGRRSVILNPSRLVRHMRDRVLMGTLHRDGRRSKTCRWTQDRHWNVSRWQCAWTGIFGAPLSSKISS